MASDDAPRSFAAREKLKDALRALHSRAKYAPSRDINKLMGGPHSGAPSTSTINKILSGPTVPHKYDTIAKIVEALGEMAGLTSDEIQSLSGEIGILWDDAKYEKLYGRRPVSEPN